MNLIDLFFPKQCIICSKVGFEICNQCLTKIPKALPTCLICTKVSNKGLIHKRCLDIDKEISWIHGWSLLRKYKFIFKSKKKNGLFSVYVLLLDILMRKATTFEEMSDIQPISNSILDNYLSKRFKKDSDFNRLCLVGEKVHNRKELINRIRNSTFKYIVVLTIF